MTPPATADLCDDYADRVMVVEPVFRSFGAVDAFHGPMATVKVWEDNLLLRQTLEQPGEGRVLVADGGGSLHRALLGEQVAQLALANGWSGILVNGCVRDVAALARIPLGVRALHPIPMKSRKTGRGESSVPVHFAGVSFYPGHFLYADPDGIVVSETALH